MARAVLPCWRCELLQEAAKTPGSVNMMKYLRARGAPWNGFVLAEALAYENPGMFMWCFENGCPDKEAAVRYAGRHCLFFMMQCLNSLVSFLCRMSYVAR
jgi:hypothetical protein